MQGVSFLRKDIQGLRAIAVLSVVIFHISPEHLTGGFVGVDIFFVISGYLIMGQIWRALNEKRFSFTDFYAKRFKRLLPALLVVLLASTVAAYYLLLPGEYKSYTTSVISSLFYFSNFWFYGKSGYFDAELQSAPLLHTWSLSVEEQFYFFFPILLAFLYKSSYTTKKVIGLLAIIGFLTLGMSEWLISIDQSLSFYASPTRFWQFITGGLLAISAVPAPNKKLSNLLTVIGLATLAYTITTYNEMTPFPGITAIPVTLATALIIYARPEHGALGFLMNNPISNFFGNISYSFYLWHWPVIVFYKMYVFEFVDLDKYDKITILFLSIVLAAITYYCVENPARRIKLHAASFKNLVIPVSVSIGLTLLIVVTPYIQKQQFTVDQIRYENYLSYGNRYFRSGECFLSSKANDFRFFNQEKCITAKPNTYNILLIGDSHAAHWYSALEAGLKHNQTLTQVTSSGCKPLVPVEGAKRCTDLMSWAFKGLITQHKFDKIILAGRWKDSDLKRIPQTLTSLRNHVALVEFIGPVVEYDHPLPWLLAKLGNSDKLMNYANYNEKKQLDTLLKEVVTKNKGKYRSVIDVICTTEKSCQHTSSDNTPLQFDFGHLTHEGAAFILKNIYGT